MQLSTASKLLSDIFLFVKYGHNIQPAFFLLHGWQLRSSASSTVQGKPRERRLSVRAM